MNKKQTNKDGRHFAEAVGTALLCVTACVVVGVAVCLCVRDGDNVAVADETGSPTSDAVTLSVFDAAPSSASRCDDDAAGGQSVETYACSEGDFTYELSDDGTYYTVTAYGGTDTVVVIPSVWNGLPVMAVGDRVFYRSDITSLTFPDSVTEIGIELCYDCFYIEEIYWGRNITKVGHNAFVCHDGTVEEELPNITAVYMADMTNFLTIDFNNKYENPVCAVGSNKGYLYLDGQPVTDLVIPNGTTHIGDVAFMEYRKLASVTFPKSLRSIGVNSFSYCTSLTEVVIPSGVTDISAYAFTNCTSLASVVFERTDGWQATNGSGTVLVFSSEEMSDSATCAAYIASSRTGYAAYAWTNTFVDEDGPILDGASLTMGEMYTNGPIKITTADAVGVAAIYWMPPDADEFSCVENDRLTISSNLVNGVYTFYAVDSWGNVSDFYYITYDDVKPTLSIDAGSFGEFVGGDFTVTATDSSPVTLYVRMDDGDWISSSGSSYTVGEKFGDGKYWFYAEDAAHNVSETVYVVLDTALPHGEWTKNDDDTYSYTWDDDTWTCTMNGERYLSGTRIFSEGVYTFVLTSSTGRVTEETFSIGHLYVAVVTEEATCLTEGRTLYECPRCGDAYYDDFTALGDHCYVPVTTEPTCTESGRVDYVCSVCGTATDDYTYLPATGHDWQDVSIPATCTENGYSGLRCSRCEMESGGETVYATGHNYVSTYAPADCENASSYVYRCSSCGDSYAVYTGYPLGHSYDAEVVESASCEEEGLRSYTCTRCGDTYTEAIAARGHSWSFSYESEEDGMRVMYYTCAFCGKIGVETIESSDVYVASAMTNIVSSYMDYMWWILLAVAGVWSIVMGVRYAMASNADDKAKAKHMIVNYVVGLVVIAVILVALPYLVYGIASLA